MSVLRIVVAPLADVDLLVPTTIDLPLLRVGCPLGDELCGASAQCAPLLAAPTAFSPYRATQAGASGKEFGPAGVLR